MSIPGTVVSAIADDATAVFWNPGGLGQLSSLHASIMYDRVGEGDFGDDMSLSRAAVAFPIGPGVAGVSAIVLMFGPYAVTDSSGMWGGEQTDFDYAGAVGYAVPSPVLLGGKGWVGGALEYVQEAEQSPMFAVSLGAVAPLASRVSVGLALRHLGPASDGFSLPSVVQAGIAYRLFQPFRLAVDVRRGLETGSSSLGLGAELRLSTIAAFRVGYRHDFEENGAGGITFGIGFGIGKIGFSVARQPYGASFVANRAALEFGR